MHTPIENVGAVSSSAEQFKLNTISQTLVDACPDLREMARDIAREILAKHHAGDLEPDRVWWHRFDRAQSSPHTFTGWQHLDPPTQSLTLPQLVMQRFNAQDQNHADELSQLSGFYSVDAHADQFDESNEVKMLPQDAMKDFWAIDFRVRFLEKLNAFWHDRADDFRTLAKAHFIGRALEDHQTGWLNNQDLQTLMGAIGVDLSQPLTLTTLQAQASSKPGTAEVCSFDVVGYTASDILRFVTAGGRQILYTPGEEQVFHPFDTPDDLHWWLLLQNNRAENRLRFMSHFPQSGHAENGSNIGLHNSLDLLFSTWGTHELSVINRSSQRLQTDPFSHLRDSAMARMFDDANTSLHSNADLRKQMWIGLLGAFTRVTGPLAALDWPIALAAVGAGLAETGLNIDQAINGHTTAERKAGVIGAVLSGIDTLFNSLFMIHPTLPGSATELLESEQALPTAEAQTPSASPVLSDLETLVPGPVYPVSGNDLLALFETNVVLDNDVPLKEPGKMNGIVVQQDGSTSIAIGDMVYRVRYANELQSWVIIDPQNPFSFYRNLPVRLTTQGVWEPFTSNGLKGGGKVFGKLGWGRPASVRPQTAPLIMPYDMPTALREELREGAESPSNKAIKGYLAGPIEGRDVYADFRNVRKRLIEDASAFYANVDIPARPPVPDVEGISPKSLIKSVLKNGEGLVVGEAHSGMGSKRFLIDNMPLLARQKVRTLYMEHLLTDFHQADLDTYAQSGKMPQALKRYIKSMDQGFHTDPSGKYSFMALVKCANENHVRIQALDSMASYRLRDEPDPRGILRQQVMNFHADKVIKAHQASIGGGKWVALVGNSHANTYEGVAGVAELEGALGLRAEDVERGMASGFDIDPGLKANIRLTGPWVEVKSDLLLRVVTKKAVAALPAPERLKHIGNFMIVKQGRMSELIHRSNDLSLVHTPIELVADKIYINRPAWGKVSGRRFDSFEELSLALTAMGMKEAA